MNINNLNLIGPEIKEQLEQDNIVREKNALLLLDIRTKVSKCISKMKRLNTDVFDECIAYDNKGANSFEICFKLFDNDDNKIRLVHLTGLVSETLERSA